jgi:hypothetical protein
MKKVFISLVLLLSAGMSQAQTTARKIQLVILFDTSNSMDGLIEQAKSRIWAIVNEASGLQYEGQMPTLEIAMYDYGNAGLSVESNFIRQQLPFTSDLDLVSEKLFGLRTNGGSEYCGAVISTSLNQLNWSADPADLKMIYVAGNEPFTQGPVSYKDACRLAESKHVFINTIYCGSYEQGVRENWKDGATCSRGDYFNINSNDRVVSIETPYDEQINQLNIQLNQTYISYGRLGKENSLKQKREDDNALLQGAAVSSERALVKSKSVYSNGSWDMVDAAKMDSTMVGKLKDEELPEELKGKSTEEKEAYIKQKSEERAKIQGEIGQLGKKREQFIQEEKTKQAGQSAQAKDDFGTAVSKSLKEKAVLNGFN